MAEERRKKLAAFGAESRSSNIFIACVYDIDGCYVRYRHLGLKK
jgi:hypothetical protein